MPDFWQNCGFRLLERSREGRLVVTDDYLRLYSLRPELAPVPESCDAELRLHASLMEAPRRDVAEAEIDAVADADARDNYRVMLRFRDRLLEAPTLEAFYARLFREEIAVPPDFIHHTAQVIARSILGETRDGLEARAAELFFRKQRVSVQDGAIMLADDETVGRHAAGAGFGNLGRLLKDAHTPARTIELDVLDEASSSRYFERDERFDTVLNLNPARPGCLALARVLERWDVGLDAEASAILNEIYNGAEVEVERMKRVIGLFRMDFRDPIVLRRELAGAPVFLGLATAPEGTLRMKPQNLLTNLPLARSA
jgi:hypothetical protein